MMFDKPKDWKQYLTPEDESRLNEILKRLSKHRGAYQNSDDIKSSQMWCAILELRKENAALLKRLEKIEFMISGFTERLRKIDEEEREILRSLDTF